MDDPIPGNYYKEQLLLTKPPEAGRYFRIESIVKSKVENGELLHYVKYLHYPRKFNKWIRESDLLK